MKPEVQTVSSLLPDDEIIREMLEKPNRHILIAAELTNGDVERKNKLIKEYQTRRDAAKKAQTVVYLDPISENRRLNPARNTDMGNAERLFQSPRAVYIRFCPALGWMLFDGKRWLPDDDGARSLATEVIHEAVKGEITQATQADNMALSNELARWWRASESAAKIAGALEMFKTFPGVIVKPTSFDTNQFMLSVGNGVVDLRTGQLWPNDPDMLLSKGTTVEYNSRAKCPTWERFLNRVFDGNKELIVYVQRIVGYSLSGETREQIWFFLHGSGANGKSVFVETISKMLGSYASRAETETFMAHDRVAGAPSPDLVKLAGARFVYASETQEGRSLAVSKIKDMTGGETLTARALHRDPFEFRPCWKLWLSGNHKPVIKDSTISTWRRIRLIPFSQTIPEEERDPDLAYKLEAELPGILAWAVRGCLSWQADGIKAPDVVSHATREYRENQDVIGNFVRDCCYIPKEAPWAVKTGFKKLYERYCSWCADVGEPPKSGRLFGEALLERGFQRKRQAGSGSTAYEGIGILDDGEV